jgi:hypothetical protein
VIRFAVVFVTVLGCGQTIRSTFQATDPTFTPSPGPTPRVYVESNRADIPRVKLRSVGVLAITVAKKYGLSRAVELAADKGRELGCWAVIEHSTFETLQSHALSFDARVILAHGPPHTPKHAGPPTTLTVEFDCVLPASDGDLAVPRRYPR